MTRTPNSSYRSQPLPKGWDKLRARILRRDGGACQLGHPGCTGTATEVDHVTPAARGGNDDPSNLQSVCTNCHRIKTTAENPMTQSRNRPKPPHPGDLT